MITRVRVALLAALIVVVAMAASRAAAADITGMWKASFDTQIGQQNYTYTFKVTDAELTGTAKSEMGGAVEIKEGKVSGSTVTFVENFTFQDMQIRIEYTGQITSDDEIKFTRKVADFATEQLVATRVKP